MSNPATHSDGSVGLLQQTDLQFQANLYDSANPTRRWLHRQRRDWIMGSLDWVHGQLRASGESRPIAMDIGVGCGLYTREFASRGYSVQAVDINESFLDAVRPIATTLVGDIQDRAFVDSLVPCDVILCSEVIEHIGDSTTALKNLYRALVPGGCLILTTPQAWSTVERTAKLLGVPGVKQLARLVYKEPVDELGHINLLTRGQLRKQYEAAGFTLVTGEVTGFYLPGFAEFGGTFAQRVLAAIERRAAGSALLSHVLWTQCMVLRRPVRAI